MEDRPSFWKKILLDSARLKRGSCVVVDGFREQLDELEMLASECYVQGIYPILKLSLSHHSLERIKSKGAEEDLRARHLLALVDGVDAWISIFGWQSGKEKDPIMYPPEYQPSGEVFEKMAEKKVKFILVMLPPPEGHPLGDVVRKALECDYDQISHLGRRLKNILQDSETVDIKTKYGTRLHFSLKNRPILVEDGVLNQQDMKEDFTLALPSGVVCSYPVENTVHGTAFVEEAREYIYGTGEVKDLTLEFEHGRLVDWKAKKGASSIEKFLEKTSGTSDTLCEVCFGINKKVDKYVGLPNIDELRYGAADIAIGNNSPFGKSRTTPPVHWHLSLGEISLSAQGKTLIEKGEIVCSRKQKSAREMRHSQSVSEVPDVDERDLL